MKNVTFGSPAPGVTYVHRPAAYAVITTGEGRVAVVKGKCGYFLPGGGSLPGEAPEATVRREVGEELGRSIRIVGGLGEAIEYFSTAEQHFKMEAVFFAAEFADEPSGQGEHELHWLDLSSAEAAFFHQSHAWAIRQV
jgi:8-oxo-dGTP pyrophosphatase MutT (NUDIX family)